ncbi:MAG TPA: hemerythrin domain-containing protein [Methanomicrobiales archaeon]|nr:hemerythrin domain-containing protein [Methanomicrobiales archaeon]
MAEVTIGEFIKRDHDDFRLMFERLWNSTSGDVPLRKEVYPFLVNRILCHHVAEEATIFPLMEKNPDLLDMTLVLIEEHRGMAMLADFLMETPWEDRLWRPRIFPFYDVISSHWSREETEVFPHSWFYFSRKEQEEIGARFMGVLGREWKQKKVHGGVPRVMFRR